MNQRVKIWYFEYIDIFTLKLSIVLSDSRNTEFLFSPTTAGSQDIDDLIQWINMSIKASSFSELFPFIISPQVRSDRILKTLDEGTEYFQNFLYKEKKVVVMDY